MVLGSRWMYLVVFMAAVLFLSGCDQEDKDSRDLKSELQEILKEDPDLVLEILQDNKTVLARLVQEGQQELEEQAWREDVLSQIKDPLEPEITEERIIMGNPEGEIRIVVYFNFICPSCHALSREVKNLVQEYPEQTALIFKHIARDEASRQAALYFEAIAVQDQQQALQFQEMAFERSHKLNMDKDKTLQEIVQKLDLDESRLQEDLQQNALQERLQKDLKEAEELGIQGTPVVLVNGIKMQGFVSRQELKKVFSVITDNITADETDFFDDEESDLCLDDIQDCE